MKIRDPQQFETNDRNYCLDHFINHPVESLKFYAFLEESLLSKREES